MRGAYDYTSSQIAKPVGTSGASSSRAIYRNPKRKVDHEHGAGTSRREHLRPRPGQRSSSIYSYGML